MKANERLYLTADKSRVVTEGNKDAAFLLAAVGNEIPAEYVHLIGVEKKEAKEVIVDKEVKAVDTKEVKKKEKKTVKFGGGGR